MIIYNFSGIEECKTIDELNTIIDIRHKTGVNEFIIVDESNEYPYLIFMVKNEYAVLNYYPNEEGLVFQANAENNELISTDTSVFCYGTPYQETEVWNKFVVLFTKAKEVAIEFFEKVSLPTCIEWSIL